MVWSSYPYREASAGLSPDRSTCSPEEAVLYGLLVVIGLIPILIALVTEAKFGAEASIGMLMVGAGLLGLRPVGRTRRSRGEPGDRA